MSIARPIYDDSNVESSNDELEKGEIVSDSDNEGGANGSESNEEAPGAAEAGTSNEAIGERDLSDDDSLEEGEIVSDSENGDDDLTEGNDEDVTQDDVIDREVSNSGGDDNNFDDSDNEAEEAPGPNDAEPEPATDDEWNRYVEVIQEQEMRVRKFNIVGYQVEFAISEELGEAENLSETLERLIQRKIDESEERATEVGFEVGWLGMAFFVEGMDHEFLVPFRPKRENNARKLAAAMTEYDQTRRSGPHQSDNIIE